MCICIGVCIGVYLCICIYCYVINSNPKRLDHVIHTWINMWYWDIEWDRSSLNDLLFKCMWYHFMRSYRCHVELAGLTDSLNHWLSISDVCEWQVPRLCSGAGVTNYVYFFLFTYIFYTYNILIMIIILIIYIYITYTYTLHTISPHHLIVYWCYTQLYSERTIEWIITP